MKKLILATFICLASVVITNAQELGVRFGGNGWDGSAGVDAVFKINELGRIHADAYFAKGATGIDLLWDFVNKPLGNVDELTWYAGVGPSFFFFKDNSQFAVTGEIGMEYHFNGVPIAIGADWRPHLFFTSSDNFRGSGFGINVRYVFGK